MAKSTTISSKPARSKTRAATATPRRAAKAVVKKTAMITPLVKDPKKALVDDVEPVELTKKELIERMVEQTEMKKGDARRALDAVLTVLGGALAEGANMSAAPLGKIKIARTKDTKNGQLVVCRIKLKKPEAAEKVDADNTHDDD